MKVCYALENWLCLKMLNDIRYSSILTKCIGVKKKCECDPHKLYALKFADQMVAATLTRLNMTNMYPKNVRMLKYPHQSLIIYAII